MILVPQAKQATGYPRVRAMFLALFLGLGASVPGHGQNLLPNPRFDRGVSTTPEDWNLAGGRGSWNASTGISLQGGGEDSGEWRSTETPLEPGGLYRLSVAGRRAPGTSGGTGVVGLGRVGRDFPLTDENRVESFVLKLPRDSFRESVRLGQWHVRGTVTFRAVRLAPVRAVHGEEGSGPRLGEGESVRAGVYRFDANLDWEGANFHRPLVSHRAGFNSNRWLFQPGAEVLYTHEIPGHEQAAATVRAAINHHTAGSLTIEVSRDGSRWTRLGELDGTKREGAWALPGALLPAGKVLVRLSPSGAGAGFQVDTYGYEARLKGEVADVEGITRFVEAPIADSEPQELKVAAHGARGFLDDPTHGEWLGSNAVVTAWSADSMAKVGRRRPAPNRPVSDSTAPGQGPAIRIALARGEYEATQIVLSPGTAARLDSASVGEFRDAAGNARPGLETRWEEVAYVAVTRPTDTSCVRGDYPDPLPPLETPLNLRAGMNQPLWLTVHARSEAMPGIARAIVELRVDGQSLRLPLEVEVFDFELPRETHLRSALGLGAGEIRRYHRLDARNDEVAVFEKYLKNFAEHRISPYSFYDHAPIDVRFVEREGRKVAQVDFAAFDVAAERWLGEGGFNTFQLPLRGMGGGTFHSRHPGSLEGFAEGTPEHTRLFADYLGQVERHLCDRGWLSKAFTYWFDEPDPKDYEFVVAGMKRLRAAAPGIRRMLTEQPEPALLGHVDIWCGLTPEWTRETVRGRRAAGEEVWWYICTAPKAPHVTEFIDHPGTELRLWPWQSWQYGVTGILVWATIYWNSPLAYPEPARQDPWRDPMSWVTGYGYPVGRRSPWGNGDGRFLYPPRATSSGQGPVLEGPVTSVRWENLRDGMEDYEYLWMLNREAERLSKAGSAPELVASARSLLEVPAGVSRDLTHFATVPGPIREHRLAVARLLERLQRVR